jgi:hypothetical protein
MAWLSFPTKKDRVRLQAIHALFSFMTIKHDCKETRDCIHAILKVGLGEVRVRLMLHTVVAPPPTWIISRSPNNPRFESKIVPAYQNFFRSNLGMCGQTGSFLFLGKIDFIDYRFLPLILH